MVWRVALKAYLVLTLLFLASAIAAETKIYKVRKADGSIVYTDKPPPGAKEFELRTKANVVPSIQNKSTRSASNRPGVSSSSQPTIAYDFKITSPANEATIRSNEGKVSITASIIPANPGIFELLINDTVHGVSSSPQFNLENLDRGEYNIKINFLDQTGKLLASTPPSRFYIQKVSALLRAN